MLHFGACRICQRWNSYNANACSFCGSAAIEKVSLPEPDSNAGFLWIAALVIAAVMFTAGYVVRSFQGFSTPVAVPASSFTPVYQSPQRQPEAREYITGPRGGCYYINRNGSKTYVDRRMCQ